MKIELKDFQVTCARGILAKLDSARADLIPDWGNTVREGGEIEVDVTSVAIGAMNVAGRTTTKMVLSPENIDQLFEEAGRMLAAGEGLHRTYWKKYQDKAKPNECKLEVFAIVRQGETGRPGRRPGRWELLRIWKRYSTRFDLNFVLDTPP